MIFVAMTTVGDADLLQLLSKEDLEKILKQLKTNLPESIRDHHYLFHYLKNYNLINNTVIARNLSAACKPTFYGPRNCCFENCTFIAISQEEATDYWIFLSTQEDNGKELIECLKNTKLINWFAQPIFFSCDGKHFGKVYETLRMKAPNWIVEEPEDVYYMPKLKINFLPDIKIPKTYHVKVLSKENAKVIDDNWSHKYEGSLKLITSSIELNGGVGLFAEHGEMVTWMVTNELMCPGFLTVIKSERRKGFGSFIIVEEFKRFVKQYDIDICVRVVCNNLVSSSIMKKLGCQLVAREMWIERNKLEN